MTTATVKKRGRPPGFKGTANRPIDYVCSMCKTDTPRDDLTAKIATFKKIGPQGKTIRTRTVAWLCPFCLVNDKHWKIEKYNGPGLTPKSASA